MNFGNIFVSFCEWIHNVSLCNFGIIQKSVRDWFRVMSVLLWYCWPKISDDFRIISVSCWNHGVIVGFIMESCWDYDGNIVIRFWDANVIVMTLFWNWCDNNWDVLFLFPPSPFDFMLGSFLDQVGIVFELLWDHQQLIVILFCDHLGIIFKYFVAGASLLGHPCWGIVVGASLLLLSRCRTALLGYRCWGIAVAVVTLQDIENHLTRRKRRHESSGASRSPRRMEPLEDEFVDDAADDEDDREGKYSRIISIIIIIIIVFIIIIIIILIIIYYCYY